MKKIILCAAVVSLLAACSSEPIKPEEKAAPAPTAPATTQSGATTSSTTTAPVTATAVQTNPLKDPNNILSKRSVYFGYDQFSVDSKYNPLIEAHAAYLKSHPDAHVTLEGNTDNRGGSEYNLALGQKRAEAVRKLLQLSGAPANQMEAISYGEERPKVAGDTEAAWAENRRTDLHYKGD
jgi:peptidoglycan-associated lipoprotein